MVRSRVLKSMLAGTACALGLAGAAMAQTRDFNIPGGDLKGALDAYARQSGAQLIYRVEDVRSARSHGVHGALSPDQALARILDGTSFTVQRDASGALAIVRAASGPQSSGAPAEPDRATQIEEVVVTAQKREERLIDTPQSVTALTGKDLARIGAVQFRDFANTIPGLSFATAGAGNTQISLRGVTTGFDVSPTVGIYVDDVPYGSSTNFANSSLLGLDAALFDLDRVEVLRGPQGTLYGASALGGLIKYVAKRPDTTRFGGSAQAGVSATQSGGANYDLAATLNVPIVTDKAAIRATAYETHDGGYIDNVGLGQDNVNGGDIYGGRAELLLMPTDALTIQINGFAQNIHRGGEGTANYTFAGAKPYGDLGQFRVAEEPFDERFRLVSGSLTYDFGPASLTSISSYQTVYVRNIWDVSSNYAQYCAFIGYTCRIVAVPAISKTRKFAQEVRLASKPGQTIEWLAGGFYTSETSTLSEVFNLFDPAGQSVPNGLFTYYLPSKYKEYAAFGNLTWHLTSRFDVTGGLRYARDDQSFSQTGSGLFGVTKPNTKSTENITNYLANARYRLSDHATFYLRYATGYRPGGPNYTTIDPTTGLPVGQASFEPDRLKSYEAGFKAETEDRRFGLDIAAYDIDWGNIQVTVNNGGFSGIANAPGGATIHGAELTLTARPTSAFSATAGFAYTHATLNQAEPTLGAVKGERLPGSPRFTANVSADYELPLGEMRPTVGATVRYVANRTTSFDASPSYPQYHLPAYATVDVRASLMLNPASANPVNVQLYAHNLFDERGQLSVLLPQFGARVAIMQPRTVGINLSTQF